MIKRFISFQLFIFIVSSYMPFYIAYAFADETYDRFLSREDRELESKQTNPYVKSTFLGEIYNSWKCFHIDEAQVSTDCYKSIVRFTDRNVRSLLSPIVEIDLVNEKLIFIFPNEKKHICESQAAQLDSLIQKNKSLCIFSALFDINVDSYDKSNTEYYYAHKLVTQTGSFVGDSDVIFLFEAQ